MCTKCSVQCIENLKISNHLKSILRKGGIRDMEDLLGKTLKQVAAIKGIGPEQVYTLKKELQNVGLSLTKYPCLNPLNEADSVHKLGLKVAPQNSLIYAKMMTIKDIISKTEVEIRKIRNMGPLSFLELLIALDQHGLKLQDSVN